MPGADELAGRLVEYDPSLAQSVLAAIVAELGGPADSASADDLPSFLAQLEVTRTPRLVRLSTLGAESSTEEWKMELGHCERIRALGVALATKLAASERA